LNFDEPQPTGDRNENKFKNKYQGNYLSLGDSSILTIDNDKIIQEWNILVKLTKTQIDTTEGIKLRDGLLYSKDYEKPFPLKFNGDTAILSYQYNDTIFKLSKDQILRYFKGIYFLNYREPSDIWNVKTMKLDNEGILILNTIYGGEAEIKKIQDMTDVKEITDKEGRIVDYKVSPTRKELKEILKSDLFHEGIRFQKINNK